MCGGGSVGGGLPPLSPPAPPPFFSLSLPLPPRLPRLSPSISPSFPFFLFSLSPPVPPHPLSYSPLPLSSPSLALPLSSPSPFKSGTERELFCFAPGRVQTQNVKSRAFFFFFLRGAFKTLPYLYYPHSLTSPTPSPAFPNFPRNLYKACGGENICTKSEGARQGRLYHALSVFGFCKVYDVSWWMFGGVELYDWT